MAHPPLPVSHLQLSFSHFEPRISNPFISKKEPAPYLSEFTVFPKLPTELRLKIWRVLFPEAGIVKIRMSPDYDIQETHIGGCFVCGCCSGYCTRCLYSTCDCKLCIFLQKNASRPSIITLQINSESRAETLLNFKELFPGLTSRPIYFNPKLDAVEFIDHYLAPISFAFMFAAIGRLALKYPCNLDMIQSLRVSQMYWDPEVKQYFSTRLENLPPHPRLGFDLDLKRGDLYGFHGLKELSFVCGYHENFPDSHIHSEEQVKELRAMVLQCFEREKLRYPECRIPNISVAYLNAQQAHLDHEDDGNSADFADGTETEAASIASWDSSQPESSEAELDEDVSADENDEAESQEGSLEGEFHDDSSLEEEENSLEDEFSYDAEIDEDGNPDESISQSGISSSSSQVESSSSEDQETHDEEISDDGILEDDVSSSSGGMSDEDDDEDDDDIYSDDEW